MHADTKDNKKTSEINRKAGKKKGKSNKELVDKGNAYGGLHGGKKIILNR